MYTATKPDQTEAAPYFFTYIEKVPAGDIREILQRQHADALAALSAIPEEQASYRYSSGKWSIRQVVSHINDTERVFAFRAFWFARGFEAPLSNFDQNAAIEFAEAEKRSWNGLVEEFDHVRAATLDLFLNLSEAAWRRTGYANDNPFSVRALAFITAGHVEHHLRILRDRYLGQL